MTSSKDIQYMRAALSLARRGLGRTAPNPSVGCVLVKDGRVIARGVTEDGGRPHAETIALGQANAKGATAYVSLEPCAHARESGSCSEALVKAGVARVVIACTDPDPRTAGKGIEMLRGAGVEVVTGILEDEARALNKGFFLRVSENRPLITLKAATTKDGKIAPLSGEKTWISGEIARRWAHLERSMHDAILVGIGTVLKDNPRLTTRLEGLNHKITRIILDTHLKIPLDSQLLKSGDAPLRIFYKDDPENKAKKLESLGVRLFQMDPRDLPAVVQKLAEEGITRLFVEGGAKVHASFVKAGLGDRLLWCCAPAVMGEGLAAFEGLRLEEILKSLDLKPAGTRKLGEDLLEIYEKAA